MIKELLPPLPIAIAMATSCAIPILLFLLGRGPAWLRPPGTRFVASVVISGVLIIAIVGLIDRLLPSVDWLDALAALSIFGAATLVTFIVWSGMAWGISFAMLTSIARERGSIDLKIWVRRVTGGPDFDQLARDRLKVLVKSGLVLEIAPGRYMITARGRYLWLFMRAGQWIFGISKG